MLWPNYLKLFFLGFETKPFFKFWERFGARVGLGGDGTPPNGPPRRETLARASGPTRGRKTPLRTPGCGQGCGGRRFSRAKFDVFFDQSQRRRMRFRPIRGAHFGLQGESGCFLSRDRGGENWTNEIVVFGV